MPAPRRRWPRIAKLVVWNLAATLAIFYAIHRWHLHRLRQHGFRSLDDVSRESGLPIGVVRALGSFIVDRERRDLRTLPPSRPGIVRIGAFGDSFTYGEEVAPGSSYPAELAELFRKDGLENVEVVNFGNSWYGFGQTTRLWQLYASKIDLSFVLLGPATLFEDREPAPPSKPFPREPRPSRLGFSAEASGNIQPS